MSRIALVTDLVSSDLGPAVESLHAYLERCGVTTAPFPSDAEAVLVWADRPPGRDLVDALLARAGAGVPVLLCGPTPVAYADLEAVTEAAGIVAGVPTPRHEIRLRPGPDAGGVTARIDGDALVTDRWLTLEKVRDDVEVLLT